jgi:hypothetical protein
MVQSETRGNDGSKYACTVRGLKLPKGLDGGGQGRLRSTSSISSSLLRRSRSLRPISPFNQWKRPAPRAWVISR